MITTKLPKNKPTFLNRILSGLGFRQESQETSTETASLTPDWTKAHSRNPIYVEK
jgi:hypothetical protein